MCYGLLYVTLCTFLFCNHLDGELSLSSCDCCVALPRCAIGLSAVCDCGNP